MRIHHMSIYITCHVPTVSPRKLSRIMRTWKTGYVTKKKSVLKIILPTTLIKSKKEKDAHLQGVIFAETVNHNLQQAQTRHIQTQGSNQLNVGNKKMS